MKKLVYIIHCPPSWVKTAPLALIFLKNYLGKRGISAKLIDLNIILYKILNPAPGQWLNLNKDFEENIFFIIEKKFPDILTNFYKQIKDTPFVAFSILKRNAPFAFKLAEKIKNIYPDKKIIFGGPQTLFLDRQNNLNPDYFWVIGEGEIPLYSIIKNPSQQIYRFQEIKNLDSLPFPDFTPFNPNYYSGVIPIFSSRGCAYSCRFCSEKFLYKKIRQHSPEYMAEQIIQLITKYKTNHFVFCDSMINHNNKWLKKFCCLLIKKKLPIKWSAQIRIKKCFPLELAKLLKQSGCYNAFVGLESASDKILNLMNKGFTSDDALNFFKTLTAAGLHFEISLISGYPGEEEKEFTETLNFIIKNKNYIPKIAQINPFVDYLGDFKNTAFPCEKARPRIEKVLTILEQEKIRYTKSFINNLIY